MTETDLAWSILSIAFFLGLAAAIKDPQSFKNKWLGGVVVCIRCIYIVLAIGAFIYAVIWALSVVMA
jgi:hypothetical protein